ncbi:hypothetical protein HDF16_001810 [Granulicella aggregans]|uniref:Uncharacterized protein n=1 Tax=Granulicella aggregans TaxID=474949 RepID=A0A7W8E4G6_9BACT|nr:hypothetical protein [Granulicella aggregans]
MEMDGYSWNGLIMQKRCIKIQASHSSIATAAGAPYDKLHG